MYVCMYVCMNVCITCPQRQRINNKEKKGGEKSKIVHVGMYAKRSNEGVMQ
jgi:hypothetical protein